MTDRYIDLDETQVYGPYASRKIKTVALGLVPAFDAGLTFVADELDKATAAVRSATAASRHAQGAVTTTAAVGGTALESALSVLSRFSSHLDGHAPGVIARREYFTGDGTLHGIGRSGGAVLGALGHISELLGQPTCPVQGRDAWKKEIDESAQRLGPVVQHGDEAHTDRAEASAGTQAARVAWLHAYGVAKLQVEATLRQAGKLSLLSHVFHDLAVPSGAKVTAIPDDAPPAGDGQKPGA